MKASDYVSYLRELFPTAEVEVVRRGRGRDYVIIVTARNRDEWQEFLYRIGSKEEEIGGQAEEYEKAIAGWYNKKKEVRNGMLIM